jgi:uncharacterized cupredoxin-like copper-binding protein
MTGGWPALAAVGMIVIGTLLWAGTSSAGSDASSVRTVELTTHWSSYSPSVIRARRGTVLRLVVSNLDPIDHELIIGDQAIQDAHERGTQPTHDAPGEISVAAHSVAITWWRVTGDTLFGCHMPGHWAYGMRGVIQAG